MNIPSLTSGDTVSAAAGVYDRGGILLSNGASNRVAVVSGVMLIGAGADKTTVKGASGSGENGIGPGAMRAVYLNQYAVIQGFTITGGRTESAANAAKNRGAGIDGAGGLAALCKYSQELTSTGDVVQTVASNPNAIGYASVASVKDTVKMIDVEGVTPTTETIQNGTYKVQRNFVFVTKKNAELSETAKAFFDFATSEVADDLIVKAGAVPVAR